MKLSNAAKTMIARGFIVFSILFMAFLYVDLLPLGCYVYPKVAFGVSLYGPEAFAIIFLGLLGTVLAYAKINSMLHTGPKLKVYAEFLTALYVLSAFISIFGVWCWV